MSSVTPVRIVGSTKRSPRSERLPPSSIVAPRSTASVMRLVTFSAASVLISGPTVTPSSAPSPILIPRTAAANLSAEGVVDAFLDQDAVRADAGLARVAELADHRALNGRVQVGVVEDDEGRVAAQLHGHALHRAGALGHEQLAHRGGAGEGELADRGIGGQFPADLDGLAAEDVDHSRRDARARRQLRKGMSRQRRLVGGLADHRAAGGEGRTDLSARAWRWGSSTG